MIKHSESLDTSNKPATLIKVKSSITMTKLRSSHKALHIDTMSHAGDDRKGGDSQSTIYHIMNSTQSFFSLLCR